MSKLKGIELLYNLILKDVIKNSGQASGIMSIGDSVRKLADNRLQSYLLSAAKKNIDLDKFSEDQIKYMLEMNDPYNKAKMSLKKEKGIKSADVFDLKGRKLDKDKPIMGGTQDDLDKKADGGRIGLKDGPKFNIAATGSKSGRQQIDKAPEGITRDQETFQAIMNADIPLNDKLNFLANLQYSKNRIRIDKDKDELVLFEGGSKNREFGLGYNEGEEGLSGKVMYNIDTNEPEFKIGFSKKFAGGGRVGLKDGMDRRKFLKIMGGLASIPILGKFFKLAKVAEGTKVASDVASTVSKSTPPPYFFELVNKIKSLGKPDKVTYADRVEIHRYTGKNGDDYELIEDLSTGDIKITKDKLGSAGSGEKTYEGVMDRSVMEYKKGDVNIDPDKKIASKAPDEYDEYKVEFDVDGTEADADNISEFIRKEIIEEVNQQAPKIKKAGGGVAYMLGE